MRRRGTTEMDGGPSGPGSPLGAPLEGPLEGPPGDRPPGDAARAVDVVASRPAATRVAIAIHDLPFHQEVLDHLDRDARIEVVASEVDPSFERVAELSVPGGAEADAVVVCPAFIGSADGWAAPTARVLVVAQEMTVPVLRAAIAAGAHGVYRWPEEREDLARAARAARAARVEARTPAGRRARVVAVVGARGGAGATFVATHLAAAFADRGLRAVLVDLDLACGDVAAALGIGGEDASSILDLVPVADELSPDHLDRALIRHPRGFAALLAPPRAIEPGALAPGVARGILALLAGAADVLVAHLPRALDAGARAALDLADEVLLVSGLDLFSLYGARRTAGTLRRGDRPADLRVVLNAPDGRGLGPRDVERILGVRPLATIRFDGRVAPAQDRGELLPPRSRRSMVDIRRIAAGLAPVGARAGTSSGPGVPSGRVEGER